MRIGVLLIRIMFRFVPKCHSPAFITIFHLNPITTFFIRNKDSLNSIGWTYKSHIIGLVGIRLPLCAIRTAPL